MVPFGEESNSAGLTGLVEGQVADLEVPGSPPSALRPYLLDSMYLGGLLFAVPYLMACGKSRQLVDHFKRRTRAVPQRDGTRPCVWIHGVSVGEVFSARHFLRLLGEEFSQWETVLSSTTRAGVEVARRQFQDTQVFSYPFDMSFMVRRTLDRIRPDLMIIVEHELWPNLLSYAQARGIPVVIVNGRLSQRSARGYRWLSRFMDWPPPGVVRICAEDQSSADAFAKLGVPEERIFVTGNFKFDNPVTLKDAARGRLGIADPEWVLVGASTHRGEESHLLNAFKALHQEDHNARAIIAPRRVERVHELEKLVSGLGLQPCRLSDRVATNGNGNGTGSSNGRGRVVLVDTVGELQNIASAGDAVFVGGSLVPFGGHNVIEPASLGRPVLIGPHHQNFRQIVDTFTSRDALLVARDEADLLDKLQELKRNPSHAQDIGRRAAETVSLHAGASERTVELLRPLFEHLERRRTRRSPQNS